MDYNNGKIYCIRNHINDEVYVGSTCQPLSKRMVEHRKCRFTTKKNNKKLYQQMNELGVEHFYIELIKECQCENKEQLRAIEGEYIRQLGTLNSRIEGRTDKQYWNDTRERWLEYGKEYRIQKKDIIRERQANYRENNKEKLNEQDKEYYEKTKHITYICDACNEELSIKHKARHERTKKHQKQNEIL